MDRLSDDAIADAIRIRTTFGLAADPRFVESVAQDVSGYPDMTWSVPLSEDEAADLNGRVRLQESLQPAYESASAREDYAGMYFDQLAGGVPVFLFAQPDDSIARSLATLLPAGTVFRVEAREVPYTDLQNITERLDSDTQSWLADGIEIVSYGIAEAENVVRIGVSGGSTAAAEARLRAEYGGRVSVFAQGPAAADACTKDNCWPPKGGLTIISTYATFQAKCTSAFLGWRTDTSKHVVITAGHCLWVGGGNGIGWTHHGNTIGNSQAYVWQDYKNADVGMINIRNAVESSMSDFDQYYVGGGNIWHLSGILPWTSQHEGYGVCRMGATSDLDCGTIYVRAVTRKSCVETSSIPKTCKWIYYTNEVDFDSSGGDSGGSVFAPGSTTGYGLHVHSWETGDPGPVHGWYSPLDLAQSTLETTTGINFEWCTIQPSSPC